MAYWKAALQTSRESSPRSTAVAGLAGVDFSYLFFSLWPYVSSIAGTQGLS